MMSVIMLHPTTTTCARENIFLTISRITVSYLYDNYIIIVVWHSERWSKKQQTQRNDSLKPYIASKDFFNTLPRRITRACVRVREKKILNAKHRLKIKTCYESEIILLYNDDGIMVAPRCGRKLFLYSQCSDKNIYIFVLLLLLLRVKTSCP